MYSLLLVIIYLGFISLGLPDALLGSAWTVMRLELDVPLSYAGIIFAIISGGTIVSSLGSDRLTKKFGAGLVTAVSVAATAVSLLGFSLSGSFYMLCFLAVPYGLGAGAVDAALNNFVALNYKSKHMNWLHCCWGVGATISPYIMSRALTGGAGGGMGYETVAIIQLALTVIMFASLPLWRGKKKSGARVSLASVPDAPPAKPLKMSQVIRIKGVRYILPAFFAYCALEQTAGLWASSFLVLQRDINPETAAQYASFVFLGITAGRFISGFVSDKIGDKNMLRIGIGVILAGIAAVWLPGAPGWLCLNGLIVIGLGCAPVYPAIIHATPSSFGKENSQAVIGVQMASAYVGITVMPPLFGLIADNISISLYPLYLLLLAAAMLVLTEKLNSVLAKKQRKGTETPKTPKDI